jgi:ABC-type multidrug transport system fused ATPase/permease subunit
VIGALSELGDDITVLMIAHRLSTLSHCDSILILEAQRQIRVVTYSALLDTHTAFNNVNQQAKEVIHA